jgi:hypothetical protein
MGFIDLALCVIGRTWFVSSSFPQKPTRRKLVGPEKSLGRGFILSVRRIHNSHWMGQLLALLSPDTRIDYLLHHLPKNASNYLFIKYEIITNAGNVKARISAYQIDRAGRLYVWFDL